jgi:hypothetical protein
VLAGLASAAFAAEDVNTKRILDDPMWDHVLSTVSPARQGRAFRLIGQGSNGVALELFDIQWPSFFFKNPSFVCIVA